MFAGKQPHVTDAFYKIIFLVILLAKILEIHLSSGKTFFLNELYFTSFQINSQVFDCPAACNKIPGLALGSHLFKDNSVQAAHLQMLM